MDQSHKNAINLISIQRRIEKEKVPATTIQLLGAGGFGAIIGWFVYYMKRYRKEDVKLSDLATLIGIIGGGAILAIFPEKSDLFGLGLMLTVILTGVVLLYFPKSGTLRHYSRNFHPALVVGIYLFLLLHILNLYS